MEHNRQNQTTGLRAGVGKVDITCREKGVWKDLLSEKVQKHIPPDYLEKEIQIDDPVFVRCLALDDGREKVLLLTMDVTAIGARTISQNILADSADDFMPNLRARVEAEFGVAGANVCVSASHTHQVPRMLCDDAAQIDKTLEAIGQALDNLAPVTLGVGSGREDRLTFNRTMTMKDGTDYTIRGCNPFPPDEEVEGLRPIDPEIGVLRVDRLDGRPLALLYNFATHLLLGSPKGNHGHITADHVGVVSQTIRENLGDDVVVLFQQGAGGDAGEIAKSDVEQPHGSREFGVKLAQSVLAAYRDIPTSGDARLKVARRAVEFPLRTDIPKVVDDLKHEQAEMTASLRYTGLNFRAFLPLYLKYSLSPDYPAHRFYRYAQADACGDPGFRAMDERNRSAVAKYLDSIRKMERMARNEEKIATLVKHQEIIDELGGGTVPAEIQGIRIGDCALVTAPMEVLAEIGFNVKKASPFEHTYIVSISNGYLHYSPPASYYGRGGYEVTECLLAPEWEAIFDKAVREIFDELKTSDL